MPQNGAVRTSSSARRRNTAWTAPRSVTASSTARTAPTSVTASPWAARRRRQRPSGTATVPPVCCWSGRGASGAGSAWTGWTEWCARAEAAGESRSSAGQSARRSPTSEWGRAMTGPGGWMTWILASQACIRIDNFALWVASDGTTGLV